jgi:hypothetical protein
MLTVESMNGVEPGTVLAKCLSITTLLEIYCLTVPVIAFISHTKPDLLTMLMLTSH